METQTTIKVDRDVKKALAQMKLDNDYARLSDALRRLLEDSGYL